MPLDAVEKEICRGEFDRLDNAVFCPTDNAERWRNTTNGLVVHGIRSQNVRADDCYELRIRLEADFMRLFFDRHIELT